MQAVIGTPPETIFRPKPPASEQTLRRELPCPYGDHVGVFADLGGTDALLTCRQCGGTFVATVGATANHDVIPQPQTLDLAQFAVVAWAQSSERLFYFMGPHELFVREGDDFSIVYDHQNRPSWLINHTLDDHRWRLGALDAESHAGGELNVGRVMAALVVWALVLMLVLRGHGMVVGVAWAAYLAGMLVAPIVLARRRGRRIVRWTLGSLVTGGAAGFVLAFARSSDARGDDSNFFRIWIPSGLGAAFAIFGLIDIVSSAGNGAGVWLALAALLSFVAFRNRQGERT